MHVDTLVVAFIERNIDRFVNPVPKTTSVVDFDA